MSSERMWHSSLSCHRVSIQGALMQVDLDTGLLGFFFFFFFKHCKYSTNVFICICSCICFAAIELQNVAVSPRLEM